MPCFNYTFFVTFVTLPASKNRPKCNPMHISLHVCNTYVPLSLQNVAQTLAIKRLLKWEISATCGHPVGNLNAKAEMMRNLSLTQQQPAWWKKLLNFVFNCWRQSDTRSGYCIAAASVSALLNQGCQMVYFQTRNSSLGKIWMAIEWKMSVYIMVI
jgi:hypothetical protein